MRKEGFLAPESIAEAGERFEELGPSAQRITREVAVAMGVDADEYRERVTPTVVETTRAALFGSLLLVRTAERERFDSWIEQPEYADFDIQIEGSENVGKVAWHVAPMVERIIAATYENEREAAVSTLRRMTWGRIYRDHLVAGD